ncbi:hypothetical protein L218DRAFT_166647 [Marasmius fiardii PR-910]|nr:hypothetical protein L218DRAFT_166647 [Marasmius fiardii PR-910]
MHPRFHVHRPTRLLSPGDRDAHPHMSKKAVHWGHCRMGNRQRELPRRASVAPLSMNRPSTGLAAAKRDAGKRQMTSDRGLPRAEDAEGPLAGPGYKATSPYPGWSASDDTSLALCPVIPM